MVLVPQRGCASPIIQALDEPISCPVAHGEGRVVVADEATLIALAEHGMIALRYHDDAYPANPNGSVAAIAGLCNPAGNVLGLMPHPENHIRAWQHPTATRGAGGGLGLRLIEELLAHA